MEGQDEYKFFIEACGAYNLENIQVLNFGGINDLDKYMNMLVKTTSNLKKVNSLAVIRDAEKNIRGGIDSIRHA